MSTKYKHGDHVPTTVLAKRLDELSDVIGQPGEERDRELTRRIPAELDRDADLVLCEAAQRLVKLETERDALSAKVEAIKAEAKDWKACAQNWEANAKQWDDDWHTVKKERDALAAHVERLTSVFRRGFYSGDDDDLDAWEVEAESVLAETPATSLARLKVKWQAEAIKGLILDMISMEVDEDVKEFIKSRRDQLRRQAKEVSDV